MSADRNEFLNEMNGDDSPLTDEQKKLLNQNNPPPPNKGGGNVTSGGGVPANFLKITLHTMGKLDAPAILHFCDYSAQQINDLTLSTEHNILDNLVRILTENCWEDFDCNLFTQDELIEVLSSIILNFWRKTVDVPWLCECQDDLPEKEREVCTHTVNLTNPDLIQNIPDNVFEPIQVKTDNHVYDFKLNRVGDIITAKNESQARLAVKQKKIDNYREHGKRREEILWKKQQMQEELDRERLKLIVELTRAYCLLTVDGQPVPPDKKMAELNKIDPAILNVLFDKMNKVKMGLVKEHEVECPFCLEKKRETLIFQFMVFLPLSGQRELGESVVFSGL
jgi:hypothetical protein